MSNIGNQLEISAQILDYDPARGERLTQIMEGTLEACLSQAINLRQTRPDLAFRLEPSDAPLWRVMVTQPDFADATAPETLEAFELLANEIPVSIYEAPFLNGVSAAQLDAVREAMASETPLAEATSVTDANALLLLQLLKKGVTQYVTSQFVLRWTQTVSLKSQVRASYANLERLYTTAQVVAEVTPPAEILFSLEQIPLPSIPDAALYHAGWVKKSPTIGQVSSNKYQIIQEFWLASAVKVLYPVKA